MHMKKLLAIGTAALMLASCSSREPQLSSDNIDEVVAAMTRDEKVRMVIGMGMKGYSSDSATVGLIKGKVAGAAGSTYPVPRLGIPSVVLADGPAGLRIYPTREGDSATYYCTHFPIGTLLASTWDTALVAEVGRAIGNEVKEYGADVLLAPALNIHRHPLCGRNFEYYSEDPLVSGRIAAAYVDGVQSNGVGTSVKHFAANSQETNRMHNDALVSPRALREIYLKGFEIAVKESKPWTVMTSYNRINGEYTSESKTLVTDILCDEWGFDGMVMSDWFAGKDAVAQMVAGNHMLQPGTDKQYEMLTAALADGTLDEKVLDNNVKRILEMIVRTPTFNGYRYSDSPDLKAHAELTRRSATDGMVLLKNDNNALPLTKKAAKVALFGNTSYDFIAGGTGSGNVNRAYTVSLLDGLHNAGLGTDAGLEEEYRSFLKKYYDSLTGYKPDSFLPRRLPDEMAVSHATIEAQAKNADMAIITIGRLSGEFLDRTSDDFSLSAAAKKLIKDVSDTFRRNGKKTVVVLNVGGVVETASWRDAPDAILCAWQGGQEGGNSVADIITGKSNPSGKLTMTFPIDFADHLSSKNFPVDFKADNSSKTDSVKRKNVDYTDYDEGIFVGYRYFDTFDKNVAYPFGFGLSYTTFDYTDPSVEYADGKYIAKITVTNSGNTAGKESVQLYVSAPDKTDNGKPEKELKAFAKTAELRPGASEVLTMTFTPDDLAYFDEKSSAWIVTPGEYTVLFGASSRDIRHTTTIKADGRSRNVTPFPSPAKI